jgi:clorobiocin/coumermycin A biosynthesis protein CloN6/CouN6
MAVRDDDPVASLPALEADLVLLHAPAVFDFRDREDIYFPFLGTSGDVPITPLYEYFPLGFKTLQRFLGERGRDVRIVNLSTLLLKYPAIALDTVIDALDATLIGIDLHWMVHVQGALAVAEAVKRRRPDVPIVFGGISSTYYAEELVRYPFVDMVMRGYDTHEPMLRLIDALCGGKTLEAVPNLVWKPDAGTVKVNAFSHLPDAFACAIDWGTAPLATATRGLPILELLSTQNAGCAYNCGWCGGSRDAFRRIFPRERAMARKSRAEVRRELESMKAIPGLDRYHFYSVGSYNESPEGMRHFMDLVAETGFKSISYEQFRLPSATVLERMVAANASTSITLSPESHDPRVARLAGRGVYSNDEMERWIDLALGLGIKNIDIWYFVGMPEQDPASVRGTVDYCAHLVRRFPCGVNPMICPMIPFLDPASTFFERPDEHGYRVFCRTVEEHRRAMGRASLVNRTNYETRWLSREQLLTVGFSAVRDVMTLKADAGVLPKGLANAYKKEITDALEFDRRVYAVDCITDPRSRAAELEKLGPDIRRRNEIVLSPRVTNQAFPIPREIGGRWFDELGWPAELLDALPMAARERGPQEG